MTNPVFKMESIIPIILFISTLTSVIACNKGYGGGHGWGHDPHPVIILPKPTLFPKLKAAFIDGKLSVDYHKIIAPSLKPLPYKKGVGWIGKGWGLHQGWGHHHGFNNIHHGYHNYDYPISVGKTGHLGLSLGKGKGIGIGWGKQVGLLGPVGYGQGHLGGHGPIGGHHLGGHGHLGGGHHLGGHGHLGGGHHLGGGNHLGGGHHFGPTPIIPVEAKLPIPHGPHGHIGHSVSHNAVTVVEKGLPHVGVPHGPIGNELYGK